ncbi:MAG: cytochrome c1 [Alphaproteobacteria bacterium]|nr:cytochrome c1 [Alphaproteobacteria bacterium]
MKTILRALALTAALLAAPALTPAAHAAGEAKHPEKQAWSFQGPFGQYDQAAVRRGFVVYKQICSSCHGLKMLSYRNLGEAGGPFQAVAPKNWQLRGEEPVLGAPGHGKELVNAIDNPWVKAIAANYEVTEVDPNTGEDVTRPARPSDKFIYPYPNEGIGRAANGGAYPPDLSVIVKARHGGADYVYAFLTGFKDEPPKGVEVVEGKNYNPYFRGGWVAMANQLGIAEEAGVITYEDGTQATKQQMAKDVVTFLQWAADPKMAQRKSLGMQVMIYLLVLTALLYAAYKQVWRGQKH